MKWFPAFNVFFCIATLAVIPAQAGAALVRLKDVGRFDGWRDNYITGIGLVTGLAGTGDSARSRATRQSLSNLMARFDLNVPEGALTSRNVGAVVVTAVLPPFARAGDRIDVTVSSVGDAKSLVGGSLLMTPLKGPDDQIYCLAQGSVNVTGYKFEMNDSYQQSNHPTVGIVPGGCTVESTVLSSILKEKSTVRYLLNDPDYELSASISKRINASVEGVEAVSRDAGSVDIQVKGTMSDERLVSVLSAIESLQVEPASKARVVINERSGLIVSGADVRISPVTITQGDLRVSVTTSSVVSQPIVIGRSSAGVQTVVTRDSKIDTDPGSERSVVVHSGNTVNDLVEELSRQKVSLRQIIAVLQALRAAGALYADILIQ